MNKHRATKSEVRKARKAVQKFVGKQTAARGDKVHAELFVTMMPKAARR